MTTNPCIHDKLLGKYYYCIIAPGDEIITIIVRAGQREREKSAPGHQSQFVWPEKTQNIMLTARCYYSDVWLNGWFMHKQTNKKKNEWMMTPEFELATRFFFSRKVGSVLLVLREKHWDPTKMHDPGMLPGDIVCVGSSAFWKSTARLYLREFLSFLSSFRDERTLKCAARDESLNYTREGKQGRPGKASLVLLSFFSGFRGSSAGGQEEARGSRCRVRQRRSLIVDHVQVRLQRQTVHAGAKCVCRCGKRGAS